MEDEENQIRRELSGIDLDITKENAFMFDNVDSFVALSRENTTVKAVHLFPFDSDAENYEYWDKVGQIVGNLMELKTLQIHFLPYYASDDEYDDEETVVHVIHDWEILTRILPYVRHKISLYSPTEDYDAEVEEIQGLARAIHGHPMISEFSSATHFTFANVGPWCSTLATLPSLEKVSLGLQEPETEDQRALVNPEPLAELLRAPALRFVRFDDFYFTDRLCHATASALEVGSSLIDISFGCSFTDGGRAIIANALKRNATVTSIKFLDDCDERFCNSLAAVLLCNSTLREVSLQLPEGAGGRWLPPIFLSLGMNMTLKNLTVKICDEFGDELCAAIRSGLAKNSTLEELSLYNIIPSDDDGASCARNALSFLRTNSTLKSLTVTFERVREESYVSAFRLEAVKMMEDNPFLESLTIATVSQLKRMEGNPLVQSITIPTGRKIKCEELLAVVSALQRDTTLKTLGFQSRVQVSFGMVFLSDEEVKQLVPILMKNYGLEHFVPEIRCADDRTIKAILRLNSAGRRYLIEDGASIPKGVDVLSAVNDEIDCVFLHLLENPGLCDRRVAETTTRRRPGSLLDECSSSGK